MSAPTRYDLEHPVTLTFNKGRDDERQEETDHVEIRRPKAKDMRIADSVGGDVGQSIQLVARLTGLDEMVVDEFDAEDFAAISDIIDRFTPPGPRIGARSSAT